jgi:hypothetical protein
MLRRFQSPVLSLFSCLLILAASGDDFFLMRAAFPFALATSGPFPLDDPNTDFLQVTDTAAVASRRITHREARRDGLQATGFPSGSADHPVVTVTARSGNRPLFLADFQTPLRC